MASPISKQQAGHRESGFQRGGEVGADGGAEATIRAHNQELEARAQSHLELPMVILVEQRDKALRLLASADARAAFEQSRLVGEQDSFIKYLMSEHEAKLSGLHEQLASAQQELGRLRAISEGAHEAGTAESRSQLLAQLEYLRQSLEAATQEVEETRADATRLQEERDEAIRGMDDIRLELMSEIEGVRDEAFELETRLNETQRALEDTRDQLRDEASRFNEDLGEVRRELDERNEEVRRLRGRLATQLGAGQASRPPPPDAAQELERARREAQQLRHQLIDAKRELAKFARPPLQPARPRSVTLPTTQPFDPTGRSTTPLGFNGPSTKRG